MTKLYAFRSTVYSDDTHVVFCIKDAPRNLDRGGNDGNLVALVISTWSIAMSEQGTSEGNWENTVIAISGPVTRVDALAAVDRLIESEQGTSQTVLGRL